MNEKFRLYLNLKVSFKNKIEAFFGKKTLTSILILVIKNEKIA